MGRGTEWGVQEMQVLFTALQQRRAPRGRDRSALQRGDDETAMACSPQDLRAVHRSNKNHGLHTLLVGEYQVLSLFQTIFLSE